jgi:hypothetical protein
VWPFEAVFLVCTLAAAGLVLSFLGRESGWPIGQALGNCLLLTQIYAAHFRHGDIFPIWSTTDAYGLGTPVLLYYQKAFFYVSGTLYVLLGTLKASLTVTIGLFLVVGSYGMRLALSTLTKRKGLMLLGAVGYLFTNYVFTDWIVRGDLAEFSALMIVPWLLFWCLRFVTTGRSSWLIIPTMVLLVDTHNAIALLSLFLLFVTLVVFLVRYGLGGLRKVAVRLVVSIGAVVLILAPMLVAELRFGHFYDPAKKVKDFAFVLNDFVNPIRYFYDGSYHWFTSTGPILTVQIDFAIWITLALALVAVLASWLRAKSHGTKLALGDYFDVAALAVLVPSMALYLLLQLRASGEVYRILSPLQVIDYPYRMLAFITPIGVVLVIAVAEALYRKYPGNRAIAGASVVWLASLILLSPLTAGGNANFQISIKVPHKGAIVTTPVPSTALFALPPHFVYGNALFANSGTMFAEYLPKVVRPNGTEVNPDYTIYNTLHQKGQLAQSLSSTHCSVVQPRDTPAESLQTSYTVTCSHPTWLALPISYNAYTDITIENANGTTSTVHYVHRRTDPRIIIYVDTTRPEVLHVSLPNIWRVLF